jgi:hypothetical protein
MMFVFYNLGISAHHMLTYNGADYKKYERKLQEIKQVLDELVHNNDGPKIIWLNQYPTIDVWAKNGEAEVDVYTEKIHQYNLILRRVFLYVFLLSVNIFSKFLYIHK